MEVTVTDTTLVLVVGEGVMVETGVETEKRISSTGHSVNLIVVVGTEATEDCQNLVVHGRFVVDVVDDLPILLTSLGWHILEVETLNAK